MRKIKIHPGGRFAIGYYITGFFTAFLAFFPITCLVVFGTENDIESALPFFIVTTIFFIICSYISFALNRNLIIVENDKLIVRGQPLPHMNKIQYSFSIDVKRIKKSLIIYDNLNSKNEKYFGNIGRFNIFICYEMDDGSFYKLWVKNISEKDREFLLNLNK